MSFALLDPVASDLPDAEAAVPGTDVATLGRMRRWLGRLTEIAVALSKRIDCTAAFRRANPAAARTVDLDVVWALVARAIRWTVALQERFFAEIRQTAKAASQGRESRQGGAELRAEPATVRRASGAGTAAGRIPTEHCIDGKSLAEVVAQICADLGVAATLMEGHPEAQEIAAIAAAARAFLGGPDDTWTARPLRAAQPSAVRNPPPASAVAAAASLRVTAPDSG